MYHWHVVTFTKTSSYEYREEWDDFEFVTATHREAREEQPNEYYIWLCTNSECTYLLDEEWYDPDLPRRIWGRND